MKTNLLLFHLVFLFSNCFVGTQRDACRYELKISNQEICNPDLFSIYLVPPREGFTEIRNNTFIGHVFICLQYYEKLKDCDKDNNRFKPGFYGLLDSNTLNDLRLYKRKDVIKSSLL
ncbi:MAG: hypothetical protein MH321_10530 [Leptospiraceae bacterium]|nr:hypothetical protein [Leptospiraceae bacterium]